MLQPTLESCSERCAWLTLLCVVPHPFREPFRGSMHVCGGNRKEERRLGSMLFPAFKLQKTLRTKVPWSLLCCRYCATCNITTCLTELSNRTQSSVPAEPYLYICHVDDKRFAQFWGGGARCARTFRESRCLGRGFGARRQSEDGKPASSEPTCAENI